MSTRPPLKISLRHDWTRGEVLLGSEVDQQPEGEFVQQSQGEVATQAIFFQPTQPIPKPICDRSGNLITRKACLLLKVKRPVLKRSV